jgi:Trypsin-like peptidase domain
VELSQEEFLGHFRRCTVAIVRGAEVFGTGFFVAPGRVVTCAHVVRAAGAAVGSRIDVRWGKVTMSATVAKAGNPDAVIAADAGSDPDLALMHFDPGPFILDELPPCVRLGGGPSALGREIYCFGHASGEYQENGDSLTLEYVGPSFDAIGQQVLTFKGGNVKEGMSGAPVLDIEAGTVCGVLFVSILPGTPLGGRAIPSGSLLKMFAGLQGEHDAYHSKHGQWNKFWSGRRSPGRPEEVISPPNGEAISAPGKHFVRLETRLGVSAREFYVEKRPDSFGDSSVTYRITGLRSDEEFLKGVRWSFRSTIGIIGPPKIEKEDQARVKWEPKSPQRDEALKVADKLTEMRKLEGTFRFTPPVKEGREISFSWTLRVLNQYALSDWEFDNLYSEMLHFDGTAVSRPLEFFPQLIWLPVRRLVLSLSLPPALKTGPTLRAFQHRLRQRIDRKDVLHDGLATGWPEQESAWTKPEDWVEDVVSGSRIQKKLKLLPDRPAHWELVIDEPEVGTCVSFEWPLPTTFLMVVRSAEAIRERLIEHGTAQRFGPWTDSCRQVHRQFRKFAEGVRSGYSVPQDGEQERFEVTLMTYDAKSRHMVVADGLINGTDLESDDWQFAVPFGVALAGACFREGQPLFWVRKDRNPEEYFDPYLDFSEKNRHEVLLVLPVDHPGLAEAHGWHDREVGTSLKSQQLLGVVTIASDNLNSELMNLSTKPKMDNELEEVSQERVRKAMEQLSRIQEDALEMGKQVAKLFGWYGNR